MSDLRIQTCDMLPVFLLLLSSVKMTAKGSPSIGENPSCKMNPLGFLIVVRWCFLIGAEDLNSAHSVVIHKICKVTGRQMTGERSQDTIGIAGVVN